MTLLRKLYYARAPLAAAILLFLTLALPSQVHEIYRAASVDYLADPFGYALRWLPIIIAPVCATIFLALLSSAALASAPAPLLDPRTGSRLLASTCATLIGVLPLLGLILGFWLSAVKDLDGERLILAYLRELNAFAALDESFKPPQIPEYFAKYKASSEEIAQKLFEAAQFRQVLAIYALGIVAVILLILIPPAFVLEGMQPSLSSIRAVAIFVAITLAITLFVAAPAIYASVAGASPDASLKALYLELPLATLRYLTIVGVACAFFVIAGYFATVMFQFYDRVGVPLASVLLIATLTFSYFNLNDNHTVRVVENTDALPARSETEPQQGSIPSSNAHAEVDKLPVSDTTKAFIKWFRNRPQERKEIFASLRDDGTGQNVAAPYPVIIVAAQGGGIYAANFTGIALARLYERCPAIAQHVFSVVSVSGGALGAVALAASQRAQAALEAQSGSPEQARARSISECNITGVNTSGQPTPIEDRVRQFLRTDFITPTIAAGLFPDFAQRFLPVQFGVFDRARAFELAIETAWANASNATNDNFMSLPLNQSWSPDVVTRPWPMIIYTSTKSSQGGRLAFLPQKMRHVDYLFEPAKAQTLDGSRNLSAMPSTADLRVSTAVGVGARFPVILPPANLPGDNVTVSRRFVDGAYFENSAIETAIDLIDFFEQEFRVISLINPAIFDKDTVAFYLLVLTEDVHPAESWSFNEFGGHLQALMMTRVRRSELAVSKLPSLARISDAYAGDWTIRLDASGFNLPFGLWQSRYTQELIARQVAMMNDLDPSYCESVNFSGRVPNWYNVGNPLHRAISAVHENNCSYVNLLRLITREAN
ncbi:MAG: hypothetical protein AAGC70_11500 [Pseudomonadota bacterium]